MLNGEENFRWHVDFRFLVTRSYFLIYHQSDHIFSNISTYNYCFYFIVFIKLIEFWYIFSPFQMPSLNPARSLGPSFVLSRWESHWVCWVGGIGGGIACALLHEWGSRRPRANSNSRASSPRDLDELDKPAFPSHHHYRHAPTYCSAAAPRPDTTEPLYSGTKSLYCRSPPPARHTLHRSDGSTCQM